MNPMIRIAPGLATFTAINKKGSPVSNATVPGSTIQSKGMNPVIIAIKFSTK